MLTRRMLYALILTLPAAATADAQVAEQDRVRDASAVLADITRVPEKGLPISLLREAQAIMIFPDMLKAGFIIGGRHGHGVVLVRNEQGLWGYPVLLSISGGSIGGQIGVQATDLVLVFKSRRGVENLLRGKHLTLGADVSVAAGPIGRSIEAGTDTAFRSEILSYSRSRGLFAGIAADGSKVKVDHAANTAFYGKPAPPVEVVLDGRLATMPTVANDLRNQLTQIAPPRK